MHIRTIQDTDIPAVAKLMRSLSDEFIVHESSAEAADRFARENDESGVRAFIGAGMRYHVAELDGELVGFIVVRENKHLFHMFVAKAHHRKGIASALWQEARRSALAAGNPGVFTVNASNYAVPVYEAMGFVRTAPMQCMHEIYFNPMRLEESHNE